MGALTTGIVMADVWFQHSDRVPTHIILGGIATALFYVLCKNGYEMINWVFLAVIPVFTIISLGTTTVKSQVQDQPDDTPNGGCLRCKVPKSSCPCVKPPPAPKCDDSPKCGEAKIQASINTEDPTPKTKQWYHNQTNL